MKSANELLSTKNLKNKHLLSLWKGYEFEYYCTLILLYIYLEGVLSVTYYQALNLSSIYFIYIIKPLPDGLIFLINCTSTSN